MIISNFLKSIYDRDTLLFRVGLFHFIVFILLFGPLLLDDRQILDINPWIKPMKFCLSIAIYTWTMAFYLDYLRPYTKWVTPLSMIIGSTMLLEILIILVQSARGVPSHFNFSTGLDAALFGTMGGLIGINTVAIVVVLILYMIKNPKLDKAFLTSLRIGLALFIIASWVGGLMVGNSAHTIGGEDGGPGLPFINWSSQFGDLRVAHFFGLHAIQIFPLLTLWIKKKFDLDMRSRLVILMVITLLFSTFLTFVFLQAVQGQPFIKT